MTSTRTAVLTAALAVALISLLVYLPALNCGFVNWDDQIYILNNSAIRSFDRNLLTWAFTDSSVWWIPLTWLSLAVDYHFWHLDPFGYHLTNIVLHAVNGGLVVLLAERLLKCRSGAAEGGHFAVLVLAGLLWSVHPLRVESVAWATERKDVLNGVFSIGATICYLLYADREQEGRGTRWAYLASLALFGCSLLAKPVSVVLPVLFIVADWCLVGRLRTGNVLRALADKIPFLALSAAMTVWTLASAGENSVLAPLSLYQRVIISGNALFEYVRLSLYPVGIIPLYFIPTPIPSSYAVKALIAAMCGAACLVVGSKRPWLFATAGWFVLLVLPTLAFNQNGIQAFASRFTYLPSIVPSIAVAVILGRLHGWLGRFSRTLPRFLFVLGVVAVIVWYGAMTYRSIGVWKNSGTMWSRVIAFQPFDQAYFYRGLFYSDTGNYALAIADYTTCLSIAQQEGLPELFNILAFRGEAYVKAGRFDEAVRDFTAAIRLSPHPLYFYQRGMALRGMGKNAEAEDDFRRAGKAKGQMQWFSR